MKLYLKGASRCLICMCICITSMGHAQDSVQCNELIKNGIEDMMNVRYASAIENLTIAQQMAQSANWTKQQFLAANNLGLTYYKMMDYGNALMHLLEAYELALLQKNETNEMTVLNNIAILYIKEKKIDQAETYFLKSFEIAKEHQIDNRIGLYALNLAQLNLEMKRLPMAENYIAVALDKIADGSRDLLNAKIIQNYLLIEKGNYLEVQRNGSELLKEAADKQYLEEKTETLLLLSKAYANNNQWDRAFQYSEKGLLSTQNNELKIKLFELHAQNALQLHDIDQAMAAKDSIIALTQIVNDTKNKELLENTTLRFELSESKHALNINKAKAENHRKVYVLLIILLILVVIVLVVVFYKRNQIVQQKRIIADNVLRIKSLELEHEKKNSQLLENEIESKNKMLSDKILFQTTRNELIEDIVETIAKDPKIKSNVTLINTVRDLKKHLKEDSKWEDFTAYFENVNNEFIQALKRKHPNLNANDIRFISFIYMDLNTKEIASLLNISPESSRKRKERLKKKLNISNGTSLYNYLSQII